MTTAHCTVVTGAAGERCGATAVVTFTGRNGDAFAECAEHDVSGIVAKARRAFAVGTTVRVFHAGIAKIGTVVAAGPVRVKVEVPVKPHGRPATTRVVTFDHTFVEVVR